MNTDEIRRVVHLLATAQDELELGMGRVKQNDPKRVAIAEAVVHIMGAISALSELA